VYISEGGFWTMCWFEENPFRNDFNIFFGI